MRVRMTANVGAYYRAGRAYDIPDTAARGYIGRGLAELVTVSAGAVPDPGPEDPGEPDPPPPAAAPPAPARAPRGRRKAPAKTPQKKEG